MSKRVKAGILSLSVIVLLFALAGGLAVRAASGQDAYRELGVYTEVLSRIRSEYVEEPNITTVTDGALHGLLESLDANSSYLTPAEYKQYKARRADTKAGIGATVSKRFGYAAVVSVIPGGPAAKAGVQDGDILEAIEGKTTREMSLAHVHSLLSGEPGSHVEVSVVRPRRPEPENLTIIREMGKIPPASEKMLQDGIGYIKVDALPKGKSHEVASRIKSLESSGAKKLILDLRNASAGDESEGVATANLFLDHGEITYLQGQRYPRQTFNADPQKVVTRLPLVVLVNRGTAGPAEIVAAAVMDNSRGDVVGEKTFGIGSIQKLIEVPDGSALILSVAKYYAPDGKAIQDTAVTPNILVAGKAPDFAPGEDDEDSQPESAQPEDNSSQQNNERPDQQLERAIEVLKAKKA